MTLRIAFFGSSRFSCLILRALLDSHHSIAAVVTQPDHPAGRHMELTPTQVAYDAGDAGIPVLKPPRLRGDDAFAQQLAELQLDALVVASYGQILTRAVLGATPWPLNVHPSLLPRLRGASPIRTALLQGLDVTGCCIMRMTPRLDDGDVLIREEQQIRPDWNYEALETALGELGGRQIVTALDSVAAGTACPVPQDHAAATYCSTYGRDATWLDWTRPAADLASFIRAWDPDIGAQTLLPSGRRLKVWRADLLRSEIPPGPPGTLHVEKTALAVSCGDGWLSLREVQPENKRRMQAAPFLAGSRLVSGERLSSKPLPG